MRPSIRQRAVLCILMFVILSLVSMRYDHTQVALWQFSEYEASGLSVDDTTPSVNLTYYSRWNQDRIPVRSGDHLVGDHIVLVASWQPSSLISQAEINVTAPALKHSIMNIQNTYIVTIDTRALYNNATCLIILKARLTNGSVVSQVVEDVFIGNFFVPTVTVLRPNGGEKWSGVNNITWTAHDLNADEELLFDVFISADSGITFQPLATRLNRTWFEWNCSTFLRRATYLVEVRVSDGIYISRDRSDGLFTAGEVEDTTTSTNNTTWYGDPYVLFIFAAITTSAIMAVIVYVAAKKWL